MQPSSLIFVAIIAIWAAYLLQHWTRRREHLATARSVDRFSEAMRVLDRRRPVAAAPTRRAYVVRPVSAPSAGSCSVPGSLAMSGAPVAPVRVGTSVGTSVGRPAVEAVVNPGARPPSSAPEQAPAESAASSTTRARAGAPVRLGSRAMRVLAGTTMRRVRAISLLVALVLVPLTLLWALFAPLMWMAPVIAVGLLVLDLTWLRHAAKSQRRARAAARVRRAREAEDALGGPVAGPAAPVEVVEAAVAARASRVADAAASARGASASTAPAAAAVVAGMPGSAAGVRGPAVAEAAAPGSWAPVPVPPPTYTLKAKAPQPAARAAREAPVFDQSVRTTEPAEPAAADPFGPGAYVDGVAPIRRSAAG